MKVLVVNMTSAPPEPGSSGSKDRKEGRAVSMWFDGVNVLDTV